MEASTTQDPTSLASTTPPTSPVRAALPPVYVGDIPIITFEDSLQDDIGEHNEEYFDSQEFLEEGKKSSCEKFEEDKFFEGDYAFPEDMTLKELWWPAEVLHNVHSLHSSKNACSEKKRRKVLGEIQVNMGGEIFCKKRVKGTPS
jgi:hypothetical protein